ncbi:unnamed protein product, partial [Adineta steineri]
MSKPTIGPQPSIVISLDVYAQLLEHQSTGKRTPAKAGKKKAGKQPPLTSNMKK